jgi:prepilin-type N-terminal cleavage/methylation domain-containing protein/prepilin-type processing-associated H-X9-DG protein
MSRTKLKAFTLLEVLVVISIVAMLTALLMPALCAARSGSRALACKSNLRQLFFANIGYATEHDSFFVPAASDLWNNVSLNRWHGSRDSLDDPFDPLKGPLVGYMADGKVRECPAKVDFISGESWKTNFEQGCGGYGYNMTYIGSRLWQSGIDNVQTWKDSYAKTTCVTEIARPGETLMFADTAMANDERYVIEYSFAEPPFTVFEGKPMRGFYLSPSIHFRHKDTASIGWADGHVSPCQMAKLDDENAYGIQSSDMKLGWFDPIDNTLFDLE